MREDLNVMHVHQSLFWAVLHGLDRDSPGRSPLWRNHYTDLYVQTQAVSLRRIVGGPQSGGDACLYRILKILEKSANSITIEWLAEMHAYATTLSRAMTDVQRHADSLEREWGNGNGTLSKAKITRDIATLKSDTDLVMTYADKQVAHKSREPVPDGLKIGDFSKAIADVVVLFRKYGRLLTTNDYAVDENEVDLGWWVPLGTLFAERGPDDVPTS
jgi:hypothetical protein